MKSELGSLVHSVAVQTILPIPLIFLLTSIVEYIIWASGDERKIAMKGGRGSYVPPAYMPLEGNQHQLSDSDVEKDKAEVVGSTRIKVGGSENYGSPQQWSSGICACCDDLQRFY